MRRVSRIIRYGFASFLIVSAYWNVWVFTRNVAALPARESDDVVVQEERYRGIRETLLGQKYGKGAVGFITNRTLQSEPETDDDKMRWSEAQYVMVPWILILKGSAVGHAAPDLESQFVIGDFWDGEPDEVPQNYTRLFDSGKGVVLFRVSAQKLP